MTPFVGPSPHSPSPQAAFQNSAEPQFSGPLKTELGKRIARQMSCERSHDEPASKRRQVSLSDKVSHLTLTAPLCQPVAALVPTAAVQPDRSTGYTFDRSALKTALYNLATGDLSRADFIVLVNQYGYRPALHRFPLRLLLPSDCLALTERACRQIVQHDGSFLEQLPPQAITCSICLAAYSFYRKNLFKLIPQDLKEPFFTQLIKREPAAILNIAIDQRTCTQRLAACCAASSVFESLSECERTPELAIGMCRSTGQGLQHIPEQQRSYELCLRACQASGEALLHVPERLKDDELCRVALSTYVLSYRWFPKRLLNDPQWQLLACQKNGSVLQWIPRQLHDKTLMEASCRSNGIALAFIDPDKISYQMCLLACLSNPLKLSKNCQYIPKRHMDEPMRRLICYTTFESSLCDRFSLNTAHFYKRLLQENPYASLSWIPEEFRVAEHYLQSCRKHWSDLKLIDEADRTPQVCLAACRGHGAALEWVPERCRTLEICQAACQSSCDAYQYVPKGGVTFESFAQMLRAQIQQSFMPLPLPLLLTHARRLLTGADVQAILAIIFTSGNYQLTVLSHDQLSFAQKRQFIEWMLEPSCRPQPQQCKNANLCEMASPLQFHMHNPELEHLLLATIKVAEHWRPPRYDSGQQLLAEIERALSTAAVGLPAGHEPLLQSQGTPAGGRTLKIDQGAEAFYYKFQRQKESLKTLMREGVVHSVRAKRPDLFGQLRSKLPGDSRFFRLYLDLLPEALPTFPDPLEIGMDEAGRKYVHVYRYVARPEYSVYAHRADHSEPGKPYRKGEQGILTACHDIGQFIALGLVPTSTLPAFHNSKSGREWMALHALLGYVNRSAHPGTFGAWNSVATEYCDFGYDGFRDVGDFEPFGKIESFTKRADAQDCIEGPEVEQCFCLANAICENLIAAQLIRARLRQQSPDYHYKNPEAQQQNQAFIEQSLICFLKGMYGERLKGERERDFLRERFELDKPAYKEWLARTAVEILYWTAKQPHPNQPDLPPFESTSPLYSHEDGYALHLNRTGRLDPNLYPNNTAEEDHIQIYPSQFYNHKRELNLGSHNAVFPLTTLMRGLTRLCTGILSYDHTAAHLALLSE